MTQKSETGKLPVGKPVSAGTKATPEDYAPEKRRKFFWNSSAFMRIRESAVLNLVFTVLVPLIVLVLLEWVARGDFAPNKQGNGFFEALGNHFPSFLIAYLLLFFVYLFISQLSGLHALATGLVGVIGIVPGIVTNYKLSMRGEPFLPWDLSQIGDLIAVKSSVEFTVQPNMIIAGMLLLLLIVLAAFVRIPRRANGKPNLVARFVTAGVALALGTVLVLGVFLSPKGTAAMGIKEDMWMQDRYYRNHGVVTGFLTNLQMLNIAEPEGYSNQKVQEIAERTGNNAGDNEPYYAASAPNQGAAGTDTPDIIYVMAESFWDVTRLPGIEYDQPLLSNLERLKQEGAYGFGYTPSFGGGTCDVEFEALTGFSIENLPAGSKPFQQYVTGETFSLPWVLKDRGYDTVAIHGYGRRFWNRDVAYPRLGIDEFIAQEDFVDPLLRRGFISDDAMVDRVIEEYEKREGTPTFIHAVTMQNHTTYSRDRYPAGELVKVTQAPASVDDSVIGQLEDCATGIREMDAAIGKLTDYLRESDRPTIVVFWGDHLNPMSDGQGLFKNTGFVDDDDKSNPRLHEVPLLIWSNFANAQVDLGTIATYNIGPVMMDLYGLEKPAMFEFLIQQLPVVRARTKGVTVQPDSSTSYEMTEAQEKAFNEHATLQYDYLFGNKNLEDYTGTG